MTYGLEFSRADDVDWPARHLLIIEFFYTIFSNLEIGEHWGEYL